MVVASVYETEERGEGNSSFLYPDAVAGFVSSVAPLVQEYYVFTSSGLATEELLSRKSGGNLHVEKLEHLFEFASRKPIHVWHDFGFGKPHTLEQLRRSSTQKFFRTTDFRIERLTKYADSGNPDWARYDGIIYPDECTRDLHLWSFGYDAGAVTARVIPSAIDFRQFPVVSREDARRILGLPINEVLYLCFSSRSPRGGADAMPVLNAFEIAASGRTDLRLAIAEVNSSGTATNIGQAVVDGESIQVSLFANMAEQVVPLLFAAADVFVHLPDTPSKDSDLALLYAAGHKLAIIATGWPTCKALLKHLSPATLLPVVSHPDIAEYLAETLVREPNEFCSFALSQAIGFDIFAVAQQISALADDAKHRQALGKAAFEGAVRANGIAKRAHSYVSFWSELKKYSSKPAEWFTPKKRLRWFGPGPTVMGSVQQLSDHSTIEVTPFGKAVLDRNMVQSELSELVFPQIVLDVLKNSQNPVKVRDILSLFADPDDACGSFLRSGALYHLLFCLKCGLVRSNMVQS